MGYPLQGGCQKKGQHCSYFSGFQQNILKRICTCMTNFEIELFFFLKIILQTKSSKEVALLEIIFTCYPWTREIDVKQGPLMCAPEPLMLL